MSSYHCPLNVNGFKMWYTGSIYGLDLNVFQSLTTCHCLQNVKDVHSRSLWAVLMSCYVEKEKYVEKTK